MRAPVRVDRGSRRGSVVRTVRLVRRRVAGRTHVADALATAVRAVLPPSCPASDDALTRR
jgi:hypothetical protein